MPDNTRRRNTIIALIVIVLLILLLLGTCIWRKPAPSPQGAATPAPIVPAPAAQSTAPTVPSAPELDEVLTPATLEAPDRVPAGTAFSVAWTGPGNDRDFVTIGAPDAAPGTYEDYRDTKEGPTLELTAPIEPGAYELRYVTGRSRTVLARASIDVTPVTATLDAPAEVVLGSTFSVAWTGPDNERDYITIVEKAADDAHYGNYADTIKGTPLTLTAPTIPGEAELRYVSGQGRKILARRPIRVIAAEVSLSGPAQATAGATIDVAWTGPNNQGDYITVVPTDTPDGQYGHYTNTAGGSPLKLLTPIMDGAAELRYMTGQGNRVLARRPIRIAAASITLSAPDQAAPGEPVTITWTGPNNPGDYITIVPVGTPETHYADYTNTTAGSPLTVKAPKQPGDAEIRYASGQGNKLLARIPIKIAP